MRLRDVKGKGGGVHHGTAAWSCGGGSETDGAAGGVEEEVRWERCSPTQRLQGQRFARRNRFAVHC
jgi:hypothetical protein